MGQYFKAVIKEKRHRVWKSFSPRTFNSWRKFFEHDYVTNNYVLYIKDLIYNVPTRVVWAGDYAENEVGKDENLYNLAKEQTINGSIENLIDYLRANQKVGAYRYLVNESKGIFLDYTKVRENDYGYSLDPMPILCAEGCMEYDGNNCVLWGTWARDFIYTTDKKPENYKEIVPDFLNTY